jgi:antitoxin VbhA-like protein
VRAEGLEPSPDDLELFVAVAAGELSTDELQASIPEFLELPELQSWIAPKWPDSYVNRRAPLLRTIVQIRI